jgi:hypothetical protein
MRRRGVVGSAEHPRVGYHMTRAPVVSVAIVSDSGQFGLFFLRGSGLTAALEPLSAFSSQLSLA